MNDIEAVARYIAARKMGLIVDVYGQRLPFDLWSRYESMARGLLALHDVDESMSIVEIMVQPA